LSQSLTDLTTPAQSALVTVTDGPHNAGTERTCRSCAVYMTKLVADKLLDAER